MGSVDLRIADLALRQHGVFTREQAFAVGASASMIRHRLASGRWGRLYAGVYRMSGSPTTWDQKLFGTWLAAGDGAAVSYRSAALQWGMPSGEEVLEISVLESRRLSLPGVRIHRVSKLDLVDRIARNGLCVTSPTRTAIDLCGRLSRTELDEVLDYVFTRRMSTPDYLRRRCVALGRQGRHATVRLIDTLDARQPTKRAPESAFERKVFDLLAEIGVPAPIPQYEIVLPDGTVARFDFAWPERMLAIEADSYTHHSGLSAWSADHVRNAAAVALGWRILPVTWTMLTEQRAWLRELVVTALAA
jgi:hypothetical protein